MPSKTSPLTSVRFFAAFLVLFHHSVRIFLPIFSSRDIHRVPKDFSGIVSLAFPVSVSFFFLLSGYVLSFVYLHKEHAIDKTSFFVARFARLYPLYFVVLVLNTPKLLASEIQRHGITIGLTKAAEIFAGNMMMLQGWYATRLLRINAPTWSLGAEVFFYLCFPLLGGSLWKLRGAPLWITALALYVGGQALTWGIRPHLNLETAMSLPLLHLSTFALGIVLARWQTMLGDRKNETPPPVPRVILVLAMSIGGVLLSVPLVPFFGIPAPYNNGLLAPFFAGLIWALTVIPTPSSRWLCRPWLVALGNSSYALYLIHTPILALFRHLQWVAPVFYPLYLALCVGLSLLSFHFFETPARLWLLQRFHSLSLRNTTGTIAYSHPGNLP